jgi:flagellum-specific ATP synthase
MNIYPAIDVLNSISRVMIDIVPPTQMQAANRFRSLLATYQDASDLIDIGAYKKGANPKIDEALNHIDGLYEFLRQDIYEDALFEDTINHLHQSVGEQVVS